MKVITYLIVSIAFFIGLISFTSQELVQPEEQYVNSETTPMEERELLLVAYHADWCPPCKKLAPKMKEAKSMLDMENITMVKFDFTNKKTKAMNQEIAVANEIEAFLPKKSKTGYILILDKNSKEELGIITSKQSSKEIVELIESFL